MEKVVLVGIDISKDDIHACVKESVGDAGSKLKGAHKFLNSHLGFTELQYWISQRSREAGSVCYVMEATGSYYENLAYFLYENHLKVSVVPANKIKYYAKSQNLKTKTDKVDACLIADFGLSQKPALWQPMSCDYKQLRDLCRARISLKQARSRAKCQLDAMHHSHDKLACILRIKAEQIALYEKLLP
jgi:transposase